MRRLHPEPAADLSILDLYDVERPRHPDGRLHLGICMVSSLDGSTVVDGSSGKLSNPTDGEVLATLRQLADVILVGAATVRAEGYGPPAKAGQRIGVVTRRGELDLSSELFTSGAGFLVCPASCPELDVDQLRVGDERVDLAQALEALGEMFPDASFVQSEGGALLNGSLLAAGLVDELHLTLSARMVGGDGPRLAAGSHDVVQGFELAHLGIDDASFLYTRWVRA